MVAVQLQIPFVTDDLHRVARGGAWFNSSASHVRAAIRVVRTPPYRSSVLGFRCAQRGRAPLKVTP